MVRRLARAAVAAAVLASAAAYGGRTMPRMASKGFGARPKFKYTGAVRPGKISPTRPVPETIAMPPYAKSGRPRDSSPAFPWVVEIKTDDEIERMRKAGRAAREILDLAGKMAKPGVTTDEIDALVHEECLKRGGYPSPLNYHGFPKSCCTSVNEIVCHGIPDNRPLEEGDMVNIDITVYLDGVHGDCSEMFCVGEVDPAGLELIQVTYNCWQAAIDFCKPGKAYKDIGGVIEDVLRKEGKERGRPFTTVRNFAGHGIGTVFHTNPTVLHYRNSERAGVMEPGQTFTIEPMICEGTADNVVWPDAWTAATKDGKRSAQFEHTLLVTENGVEALTGKLPTSMKHPWEN
mmetsp:Transcript_30415/g.97045  ORF Transcript_30415/g.97045 Transcript_30415/m.97045 type:complete len:347 (-) Transcript_30415:47-1087(-)